MAEDDGAVEKDRNTTTPFEWLTSPASLQPHILAALVRHEKNDADDDETPSAPSSARRVLHVGCGTSVLGELLVSNPTIYPDIGQVVNVDNDAETLRKMQERWQRSCHCLTNDQREVEDATRRMVFQTVDFTSDRLHWEDGSFDLAVDKSTLDCLLCNDKAAAGLLAEVYRVLKPGGCYLVVSFHQKEFLHPLFANLPGADWNVSSAVMNREVEDLIRSSRETTIRNGRESKYNSLGSVKEDFDPEYRRTLNVFQCRKNLIATTAGKLDLDSAYRHVHDTNDRWFREANPLLSENRIQEIHAAFCGKLLGLFDAYSIIFTEVEREHLEYEGFLDDWNTFLQSHPNVEANRMSSDVAIAFLDEMQ